MKYIFNKKKVSFTTYLFLCIVFQSYSDARWVFNETEKEAYRYILSLQLDKARTLISDGQPPSLYLNNLRQSLQIIITEDESLLKDYLHRSDYNTEKIEDEVNNSPYKKFYLAEIKLQRAFVLLKMGDSWAAAWDFRKAYRLITRNTKDNPDFLSNYKSLGMLHIMLGSVPQKYHWILHLLGLEGSVEEGIAEMKRVSESKNLFQSEALALSCLLNSYLLNNTNSAARDFEFIYHTDPDNLLFGYLYMSLLSKDAQGQKALQIYDHLKHLGNGYTTLNFLNYSAGEIYLQKGEYQQAENLFKEFLAHNKGNNFVKDAHYKLFLAYWLSNQSGKAAKAHDYARGVGKTETEADKHAAKSLNQAIYPNKRIMKIRMATDGGFYDTAYELIKQDFKSPSKKDSIEFIYRKARLYHKTGQEKYAINFYKETIKGSEGEIWYFAPNSCLQLGYIFQKSGHFNLAQDYFQRVLDYKDYEYQTSLDNKAKAALAILKSN